MSQEEIQQVAREEAWVPKAERVKITTTNMRIYPTMTQKEETYQVILDIIKNTTFYKAFLATTDVLEIYMQQFWHTVTKIKESTFYEFKLSNKKCQFDVELKKGSRKIMPYPRFTKIIINHFLSVYKSVPKGPPSGLHTIKDDGVLSRIKFAYKAFIGYSTCLLPPKKTKGKGSKGKQQEVTTKKKTVITIDDNIITDDPDVAFELGKSISKTDAKIIDETRRVHDTHARLVTEKDASEEESDPEPANRPTGRRRPSGITFRDTSNVPKKKSGDHSQKLKGIEMMTEEEQLAVDTMQAIKASKQTLRSQPHAGGSSKGTGITPRVSDESTVIFTTSSEGTGTVPGVPNEAKEEIEWVSTDEEKEEQDDQDDDDDKSIDIKKTDDEEETDDEFDDEYVHDDIDEEMKDAEVAETGKDEKSKEVKDDQAKVDSAQDNQATVFASTTQKSSSLSILFGFVIPEQVILSTAPPPPPSVTNLTHVLKQQTTPIPTPPITTVAPATTIVPDPLPAIAQRVSVLEKDVQELKQEFSQKEVSNICKIKNEQAEKQQMTKYLVKSSDKAAFDEYDQNSALFQTMTESKSFNNYPAYKALYHALIESLLADEEGVDQGVGKKTKKRRTKESESSNKSSTSKDTSKGNSPPKTSKSDKSVHVEESVVKPTEKVNFDDATENVVNNDDQPQDDSEPQTNHDPKHDWFKQPLWPPTPDLEWNTCQLVDDQPEQPWSNNMLSVAKDPLTFDELMPTPIDFSNFAKNRLKLDKITKIDLVGYVYNLLKGTYQSSIELEYNMEEFFKALTDRLDWENPEGDRCPFDLSKPLPLKGHPGQLTIAAEYFFNNDLEYLKSIDSERKYTTLITKKKATRYELVGIEDMIPKQWSTTKVGYDKDVVFEIKHWDLSFKEGDFVNLHLNDIEDMLLLVVQHKLLHLDGEVIVDLVVTLRMFTRSLILKKRVEDVQLGVESYQKKLNITKPQKDFPRISAKELYTPSFDTPGVVYEDLSHRKRLMRADELYKRKWSATDKKRASIMVDLIDKQMLERRILRNLERLVGARELEMDYRLMQRTI
ncbi:hypothetical protein Tco_0604835 [Tanacetum coccineum]